MLGQLIHFEKTTCESCINTTNINVKDFLPGTYRLVIKHKDFFTKKDEQYLGLENLSKFINQPVNEDITYKYNSAIEKREKFVKKYLPHYEN